MTNQLQCSRKLLSKLDAINQANGTNYELMMDWFMYTPDHALPEIKSGSVYIGKYALFNYKKLQRRKRVYGITFGKFFLGLHLGKYLYHVHMPKIHSRANVQLKYYIKGMKNLGGYSHKGMKLFLEQLT